jgi:DNA-binding response OmpR family regulator
MSSPLNIKAVALATDISAANELGSTLTRSGIPCLALTYDDAFNISNHGNADILVVGIGRRAFPAQTRDLLLRLKDIYRTHILLVLADFGTETRALASEADDFVLEPVHPEELALRVRRLVRKGGINESKYQLSHGYLTIDTEGCQVFLDGVPVDLTFKEYELLSFLAKNPGKVRTRAVLLNQVWGYDYYGGERTVDVHIRRLRVKLESGDHTFIETVRGIGYRFKAAQENREGVSRS